jgi:hypothetical protein
MKRKHLFDFECFHYLTTLRNRNEGFNPGSVEGYGKTGTSESEMMISKS